MKPMIWHPEDKDKQVNKYLDSFNHEPWLGVTILSILAICFLTILILIGVF